ncbi:MAG: hypothetical protein ACR2L2_00310 [Acidobacteriota bacterium]
MKPSHSATILHDAFVLPARSLPAAALLALRGRPDAAYCRLPTADFGCGLPRCVSVVKPLVTAPQSVTSGL